MKTPIREPEFTELRRFENEFAGLCESCQKKTR